MIIIYDIKEKILNNRKLTIELDSSTRNRNNVELFVIQKYMSLFGPFGPIDKQGVIALNTDTNQEIPEKDWPQALVTEANVLKGETPFAWGLFRNLYIVAAVFLGLSIIAPIINKNRIQNQAASMALTNEGFNSIAAGDVLAVALLTPDVGHMSLMKVVKIDGDSLFVKKNKNKVQSFEASATASLDHSDAAYEPEEIPCMLGSFKSHKGIVPHKTAANPNTQAIATAVGIEKAK